MMNDTVNDMMPETATPEMVSDAAPNAATNTEDALRSDVQSWQDKAYRAAAELENYRKRTQTEVAEARLYAAQSFARDVLSVADNLARALAAPEADTAALRKGVELTANQFETILQRHGITKTAVKAGDVLNPELHQAMMDVPSTEVAAGHIIAELQAGYTLHGRLLRPALVSVSKGGE
jgi:molecular chaperone GrpE